MQTSHKGANSPPTADLSILGGVPLNDKGAPVFAEPWEASAFALAVRLSAAGLFTWSEWADALAGEARAAGESGDPDLGGVYYRHWTRALERLCAERGLVSPEEAERRKEDWRRAYLAAPHGHPVALSPEDVLGLTYLSPPLPSREEDTGFPPSRE